MKIKIIQAGWEGFTGDFGSVQFEDGVSVEDVAPFQAQRLANLVQIETMEGKNPSASQMTIDCKSVEMSAELPSLVNPPAPVVEKVYTRGELEEIADKGGIAAVRKIAEPKGLKSTSVAKLIELVLDSQKPAAPAVTAPTEVTPEAVVAPTDTATVVAEAAPVTAAVETVPAAEVVTTPTAE